MALVNKIETAVKRLLVAGAVCSFWSDESAIVELAGLYEYPEDVLLNTALPKCTKGHDYHDKDIAAFQVIASKGEEIPPMSGNYQVTVRVLCDSQADDGANALSSIESQMNALRSCLDTNDLASRLTLAANGGLTVFPNSIWGRRVTEGVEDRKFSSCWEFTCMACEAVL